MVAVLTYIKTGYFLLSRNAYSDSLLKYKPNY